MSRPSLTITRVIKATQKQIFEAWTSADELTAWHCPEGMTVSAAECDPRVGGAFWVNMVAADGTDHRAAGRYLDVTPYSRLAFTWGWETGGDPADGSQVTITLVDLGENVTQLTLVHERLTDVESRDAHVGGWSGALNNLESHLK